MRVFSIGIDVHRRSWTVSIISEREIVFRGTISPKWPDLAKVFERDGVTPANSRIAYEAGPTGFGLYDLLTGAGYDAIVVSPNRIPQEAGPNPKTDRRDSLELARLLQGGLLRGIAVPSPEERAIRDLVRTRVRMVQRRASFFRMAKMKMLFFGVDYGDRVWSKSFASWVLAQPMPEECRTSLGRLSLEFRQPFDYLASRASETPAAGTDSGSIPSACLVWRGGRELNPRPSD